MWKPTFAIRHRTPSAPYDEPENLTGRQTERAGQQDRAQGHARAQTIVVVEDLLGAAMGDDGYSHPLQEDGEGNLFIRDGQQLLLETNRNLRILIAMIAKLADVDDPYEIDIDQDDSTTY